MEKNEVVNYYDTIAKDYDESRFNNSYGAFIDAEERRVLDKLLGKPGEALRLEVACGTGRLTNYATHGLDASAEMMKLAVERHPQVSFTQASASETPFADDSFDVVYSFHLLMHLDAETISKIFAEVHRILKPGGRFILDIPSRKRRELLHHKQESWHGASHMSTADMVATAGEGFELRSTHGIMMLPVHKLPVSLRKPLVSIDFMLANGWMREYSSYLIFEFVKK